MRNHIVTLIAVAVLIGAGLGIGVTVAGGDSDNDALAAFTEAIEDAQAQAADALDLVEAAIVAPAPDPEALRAAELEAQTDAIWADYRESQENPDGCTTRTDRSCALQAALDATAALDR